jgi:E3 ubiquitin-protein ligase ZSWIM2
MARNSTWRRTCSDAANWHQHEALNATIYIVRQSGPTGFVLKEENEEKLVKVSLGDPHRCSCATFIKEKDICKHISWLLLKKFRVSRDNPISWQLGLVEREIGELLRGHYDQPPVRQQMQSKLIVLSSDDASKPCLEQRPIGAEDVCPICQEELLLRRHPVTFCRHGCGNNVHIKCMKIWADHQSKNSRNSNSNAEDGKTVKCPMCREEFGTMAMLQTEYRNANSQVNVGKKNEHLGTICRNCQMCPIVGKCYRCSVCRDFYCCETCFAASTHQHRTFDYREQQSQPWKSIGGSSTSKAAATAHDDAISIDSTRLFSEEAVPNESSNLSTTLTENALKSFPIQHVTSNSRLLAPGVQCQVCLKCFIVGQSIRHLPCRHKFHQHCIDDWLLHRSSTCPVDGTAYSSESIRQMQQAKLQAKRNEELGQRPSDRVHAGVSVGGVFAEKLSLVGMRTGVHLTAQTNFSNDSVTHDFERNSTATAPSASGDNMLAYQSPIPSGGVNPFVLETKALLSSLRQRRHSSTEATNLHFNFDTKTHAGVGRFQQTSQRRIRRPTNVLLHHDSRSPSAPLKNANLSIDVQGTQLMPNNVQPKRR